MRLLLLAALALGACAAVRPAAPLRPPASRVVLQERTPAPVPALGDAVPPTPSARAPEALPVPPPDPSKELLWRVARHLRMAYRAVCGGQFVKAVDLCEEILLIAPDYGFARDLRRLAQRLHHMTIGDRRSLIAWLELWDAATDSSRENPLVPEDDGVRWRELARPDALLLLDGSRHRRPKGITGGDLVHEDYLEEAAFYRRLESGTLHLELAWATGAEVLDAVRDRTGLNLHVHETALERFGGTGRMPVRVSGVPLEEGLQAALAPFGLRAVARECVVLVLAR